MLKSTVRGAGMRPKWSSMDSISRQGNEIHDDALEPNGKSGFCDSRQVTRKAGKGTNFTGYAAYQDLARRPIISFE